MKKSVLHAVSGLFPAVFVSYAYKKLTSPQVHKLREHEEEVLAKSLETTYRFRDFSIQLYEWKAGPEKVLLIHGWEGQAGNFADLIEKFQAKNVTVVAFDGPGHGKSSRNARGTSLFEFADLVVELIREFEIRKLVSHSFGGVATTYALSQYPEFRIDKYVLFTTPNRFLTRIDEVATQVGLHRRVKTRLLKRLEKKIDLQLSELNVEDFVQDIGVKEALILHDTHDRVLHVDESRQVAKKWEAAILEEVTHTGHFRILRTEMVLERAVSFLELE